MVLDLAEQLRTPRLAGVPLRGVGKLRMYVCGVTPYDVTHLGHAATYVWVDVLTRFLRHLGCDVEVCRNVTDVDDVLLDAARRVGASYDSFAAVQEFHFEQDMAALGIRPPTHAPRAHNFVRPVVSLAAGLLDAGRAYVRDGSVYFRGADVVERAGLSRDEALALSAEFHDEPDDPRKDDPFDVAVWRASEPGTPAWPSPWGPGRPGWHAECAAMAMTVFGPALDVHAGGADLRFPHHAYEAAFAEALTGVRPFARSWMRIGLVHVGGAKMAKSAGNLVLVSDVLAKHSPAALRLAIVERRWWESWDFDAASLDDAEARVQELFAAAGRPERIGGVQAVLEALRDDLDVPRALAVALEDGGSAARLVAEVLGLR